MTRPTPPNQLTAYVRTYSDVFAPEACRLIIDRFEAQPETHVRHSPSDVLPYAFAEVNVSQYWPDIHNAVFGAIMPFYDQYREEIGLTYEWPSSYGHEQLRMKRYLPNDHDQFGPHVDVGDHQSAKRFLVSFIYLNDVEDGGETAFDQWGLAVKPRAGTLIMFPPLWPWLHAGRKPISGSKYILGTYLHYL